MIPLLLLLAVGVGQQVGNVTINCPNEGPCTTNPPLTFTAQPAPLKCGKYEHIESVRSMCPCNENGCHCDPPQPKCAPIMHPLKESEYQEIMERLKKLEKDSVRMTEPVIACDDPQNAKGCRWMHNPNVVHPER